MSRPLAALASVILAGLGLCAVLVVVGASGVRAEASQEEKQGRTEAAKEQGHSGGAAPEGGDRCDRTRTIVRLSAGYLTNDLPGCPNKGGLLSAQLPDTGRRKISSSNYGLLMGEKGDDEIRGGSEIHGGDGNDVIYGLSGGDWIVGDNGDDVIHGGDGNDFYLSGSEGDDVLYGGDGNEVLKGPGNLPVPGMDGGPGDDVLYGGDGNDHLYAAGQGHDKLHCGKGTDTYDADTNDFVDSSCEEGKLVDTGGPPLILLAGAALCATLMMIRYVIRSA